MLIAEQLPRVVKSPRRRYTAECLEHTVFASLNCVLSILKDCLKTDEMDLNDRYIRFRGSPRCLLDSSEAILDQRVSLMENAALNSGYPF